MTDPAGKYFISYRRTDQRTAEAVLVRNTLRDRGVPTWRDLDDLAPEPTEGELVSIIDDPSTAGAVMLISPEVESSDMIRNVEAPRIFKRHRTNDGFRVHPILIALGYGDANRVLNAPAGFQDLGDWNLTKIDGTTLSDENAGSIAKTILNYRLGAIRKLDPGRPVHIGLYNRRTASAERFALRYDFTSYFDGREAITGSFALIERALLDSASAVAAVYGGADLICSGTASLPLGVLFGAVYSPLADFRLTWLQGFAGHDKEPWSLSMGRGSISTKVSRTLGNPGSNDLVLAIGVSANIEPAVTEFMQHSDLRPRASIYIAPIDGSIQQGEMLSPQDGLTVVLDAVEAVRALKDELMIKQARLHVFLACPLAIAVLLGQKLNTFSECVLYEHFPDKTPSYNAVHSFNPSGYSYQG